MDQPPSFTWLDLDLEHILIENEFNCGSSNLRGHQHVRRLLAVLSTGVSMTIAFTPLHSLSLLMSRIFVDRDCHLLDVSRGIEKLGQPELFTFYWAAYQASPSCRPTTTSLVKTGWPFDSWYDICSLTLSGDPITHFWQSRQA